MLGLLAGLGGLGSALGGLAGLFGNKSKGNPSEAANQYLNQIPGHAKPYYQPYMDAGIGSLDTLQGEYGKLIGDPNSMYSKFAEGYKQSPGYQFKLKQGLQAGQNASAAGGMLGSPQDVQQQTQIGNDIASQDFNDYMSQISGLYGKGLEGTQGLENQGYGANTDYANMLSSILGQKGMNAFTGQQGMNQENAANWANLFSGLGSAGSAYTSGNMLDQMFKKYMGGGA